MSEASSVSLIFSILIITIFVTSVIFVIVSYILNSVAYMKCMQKAGEKGWKGWIPFYSDYIMYKIVSLNGLLVLVKILNAILSFIYLVTILFGIFMVQGDIQKYVDNKSYSSNSSSISYKNSKSIVTTSGKSTTIKSNSTNSSNAIQDARDYMNNDLINQPQYALIRLFNTIINILRRITVIGAFIINIFFAIKITKAYNLKGGYDV